MESRILFYSFIGVLFLALLFNIIPGKRKLERGVEIQDITSEMPDNITLFFCGDVMLGRGIDQILPNPGDPQIFEGYMKNAKGYIRIAEQMTGPIPYPVNYSYIWGDAFKLLESESFDLRIVNLETSVTKSDDYWKNKGINYRMNPDNIACLTSAKIDFCSLANNHVLDWGYSGLSETIETLKKSQIKYAGAGINIIEAEKPAIFNINGKGRVYVFSLGGPGCGIPYSWRATTERAGVNLLLQYSDSAVNHIIERIKRITKPRDLIIVSVHWGGNWGYDILQAQREFAHKLIDVAGVDVIHGHSSHHVKGIEVYNNKPIIYGCGDFINDYEGITGKESFRDDLSLMYFVSINPVSGELVRFDMSVTQIRHFKVNWASNRDILWMLSVLNREGRNLGTHVKLNEDNSLSLMWE